MNKEVIKKILMPFLVFLLLIQVWSIVAMSVEDFPTPSDTYVSAFVGINSEGDEISGVLADPFYCFL